MGQGAVRGMGWGERLWWMLYRHGLGRVSDGIGRIWTAFAWGEEGLDLRRGGMSCHLTMDGDIRMGRSQTSMVPYSLRRCGNPSQLPLVPPFQPRK